MKNFIVVFFLLSLSILYSQEKINKSNFLIADSQSKNKNEFQNTINAKANCTVPIEDCELVLNGGFEFYSSLPTNTGQLGIKVCQWEEARASCEYFHISGTGNANIPSGMNSLMPLSGTGGNAYIGFIYFGQNTYPYSETPGTELSMALEPNTDYRLTMNVARVNLNLGGNWNFGAPRMQAYLSTSISPATFNNPSNLGVGGFIDLSVDPDGILLNDDNHLFVENQWDDFTVTFNSGNGGQKYLFIGNINNGQFISDDIFGFEETQYCAIDNVSLRKVQNFNPILNITPETICNNSSPINISNMVTNGVPEGVFSGVGVSFNGLNYEFNPTIAGVGVHTISYTIPTPTACPEVIVTDIIEVVDCSPVLDPYISQVYVYGNDKFIEIKNPNDAQNINSGVYYLALYANGATLSITPTSVITLGFIPAQGIQVFKVPSGSDLGYVVATDWAGLDSFDGNNDIIILTTSKKQNAFADRVDWFGDTTNIGENTSLVRISCTPMGYPRTDAFDEQDWVGFTDMEVSNSNSKTNAVLGRHFSDPLRWEFNGWNDNSSDNSNPDRSREELLNFAYNTGLDGSFEACSVYLSQNISLNISASNFVSIQTSIDVTESNAQLIVENEGSLVMIRDEYYGVIGTDLVNLGTNSTMSAIKQTVGLSGPYDYVYWSSPLSTNTLNPNLNQIFNFGSSTGSLFDPNRMYLFQNQNFCDIYRRFNIANYTTVDGYDDNYDDYDPSNTLAEQTAKMIPGLGYATWPPQPSTPGVFDYSVSFNGEMNNGIVEVPVFRNNSLDGKNINLVGNPYPSAINLDIFFEENINIIEPIVYIWTRLTDDPSGSNQGPNGLNYTAANFAVYTSDMSLNVYNNNTIGLNGGVLASGQSFFVRAIKDYTGFNTASVHFEYAATTPANIHPLEEILPAGNVIFRNRMRTTEPNITFTKMANINLANNSNDDKIWLNLTDNEGYSCQLGIYFKLNGSTFYNPNEDASTIWGRKYNFYTKSTTEDLIIDVQDQFDVNKIIPLGIVAADNEGEPQYFTISVANKEGVFNKQEIYLQDNYLGTTHNLSKSAYSFTILDPISEDRFNIVFSNNLKLNSKSETNASYVKAFINENNVLKVISSNKRIKSLQVFDLYSSNSTVLRYNYNNLNEKDFSISLNDKLKFLSVRITLEDGSVITKKLAK